MRAKRKSVDDQFDALVAKDAPKVAPAKPAPEPVKAEKKADLLTAAHINRFIEAMSSAEITVAAAQRQIAEAYAVAAKPIEFPPDTSPAVVAAIDAMRREMAEGLARIAAISAADRVLVEDELGTSRSRIAR